MELLPEIRKYLGLDQKSMATFLRMSRSHYGMAECGKRRLPSKAHVRFALLVELLAPHLGQVDPVLLEPELLPLKAEREIAFRLQTCSFRLRNITRELESARSNRLKKMSLEKLMAQLPEKIDPIVLELLILSQRMTTDETLKCDTLKMKQLEWEIDLLTLEKGYWESLQKKNLKKF